MTVRPAKTEISLGAQWAAKNPVFLQADSEDWSDWADAQADLSLRWVHSQFVGCVMRRLKWCYLLNKVWIGILSKMYGNDLSCRQTKIWFSACPYIYCHIIARENCPFMKNIQMTGKSNFAVMHGEFLCSKCNSSQERCLKCEHFYIRIVINEINYQVEHLHVI